MGKNSKTEQFFIEGISRGGEQLAPLLRGLAIGKLIQILRKQLGMSQKELSKRAKIPQPNLSRIEQDKGSLNLSTLKKILDALSCDLLLIPVLRESIDMQRRKQARKLAQKHIQYLKGTMNLEEQEPDSRFFDELMKQKEEELLHSNAKLWRDK